MTTLAYPSTLPNPGGSNETSNERRRKSELSGGREQFAGRQRDYLATQKLTWFLSPAESFVFHDWWKADLKLGGAWFTAVWSSPSGWISVTRRFMTEPAWLNAGNGFWTVTADVQVRGRGMDPQA